MIGQARIEYLQSFGNSSGLRLLDILTATCLSPSGPVLPTTRSDLTLWQIPSPTTVLLLLCKDTHFVVHRWQGTPSYSGISQSKSTSWTSSSMLESRSFSYPMMLLEEAIPIELVLNNIDELTVHDRKDVVVY